MRAWNHLMPSDMIFIEPALHTAVRTSMLAPDYFGEHQSLQNLHIVIIGIVFQFPFIGFDLFLYLHLFEPDKGVKLSQKNRRVVLFPETLEVQLLAIKQHLKQLRYRFLYSETTLPQILYGFCYHLESLVNVRFS